MPPKPTCKVVKREGQRGARIDPRGCKVRTTKDAQGNKKKETKQGNEKIKRTTTKREMRLAVAGSVLLAYLPDVAVTSEGGGYGVAAAPVVQLKKLLRANDGSFI